MKGTTATTPSTITTTTTTTASNTLTHHLNATNPPQIHPMKATATAASKGDDVLPRVKFEHPTMAGNVNGGWMLRMKVRWHAVVITLQHSLQHSLTHFINTPSNTSYQHTL